MPANHRTVGKITYIHEPPVPDLSGLPPLKMRDYETHLIFDDKGNVVDAMVSRAEADPALQVQPKPIPVIAIGDLGQVRTERHYGLTDMPLPEPDEFDVWRTQPAPPKRINWWRVAGVTILVTGCLAVYLFLGLLLAQTWRFWSP